LGKKVAREKGNGEVMEAYYDLVRRVLKALRTVELDYAFTGALAASFYGLPRTTTDIDVIIRLPDESAKSKLAHALSQAGVKADEKQIDRALASGYRIATFLDSKTAYSLDFIVAREEFRKTAGAVAGLRTFFQTPEDLILAKLRMIKATVPRERALKDEEDIKAILRFTGADVETIKKRAKKDNTLPILLKLISPEDQ
jgi:hypothetical protein